LTVVGLIVLPLVADLVNAATKPILAEGDAERVAFCASSTAIRSRSCAPRRGMQSARLMGFDTPEKYAPKCLTEFHRGGTCKLGVADA
jgi:micrococcal nuclease